MLGVLMRNLCVRPHLPLLMPKVGPATQERLIERRRRNNCAELAENFWMVLIEVHSRMLRKVAIRHAQGEHLARGLVPLPVPPL